MRKILLLILPLSFFTSSAQTWQWSYNFGCAGDSVYGLSVTHDSIGNSIITGSFYGTIDFDPGPGVVNLTSNPNNAGYVVKYDPAGNYLWGFALGNGSTAFSGGNSICTDKKGNIFVTGSFAGTIDFDPGTGTHNLVSTTSTNAFLAKYDPNGNYLWAIRMGGIGSHGNGGSSVCADTSGNVFLSGYFQGTCDFNPGVGNNALTASGYTDAFIAKYDATSNYQWVLSIPCSTSNYNRCQALSTDIQGNVYAAGFLESAADFDPGSGVSTLTPKGYQDIFVAKYSGNGNYRWAFNIGAVTHGSQAIGLSVDTNSNAFVTGFFRGTQDFDPGSQTDNLTSHTGYGDIFLAKYDSAGNHQWAFNVGSTGANYNFGFSVTNDGSNAFITGCYGGTADFDPAAISHNLTAQGPSDIFLASYDANGNYRWAFDIGSPVSTSTYYSYIGYGVDADQKGNVWLTGWIQNQGNDFDPGINDYTLDVPAGEQDIFLAKYATDIVGIKQFTNSPAINIYPNPANGLFTISNSEEITQVKIVDAIGNLVFGSSPHEKEVKIQLENEGAYFVKVTTKTGISTKKIIVIK